MTSARSADALPAWAYRQRALFDRMSEATATFLDTDTRADGTFIWRDSWSGMDGSDDAYEAFQGMPLLYLLGGSDWLLPRAHRQWDATTWQFTRFGQVEREFDGYYDWMHHGESSQIMYYLALADAGSLQQRDRAIRFAAMYIGEDPLAPNWDAERQMMRSPLTGSRGPRFAVTEEDWSTHRETLERNPPPFVDLPGIGDDGMCRWTDDAVMAQIVQLFNERMSRGDVPLNLTATSLVTHAYLWTGEGKYKRWVIGYLDAWADRIVANGGICRDNIGPNGIIGERNDGRWWGGYYGWWWPHGAASILEPLIVAGCNAAMLDGDLAHLDPARSQPDLLLDLAESNGDRKVIPRRHGSRSWLDHTLGLLPYFNPAAAVALWERSHDDQDLAPIRQLIGTTQGLRPTADLRKGGVLTKDGVGNSVPFFRYLTGENPVQALEAADQAVTDRLKMIANDTGDLGELTVDDWNKRAPQICEPFVQLTTGGSINVPVRHFDARRRRPGLPDDVAIVVDDVRADSVRFRVVNVGTDEQQRLVTQAEGFGEHRFGRVTVTDAAAQSDEREHVLQPTQAGRHVEARLPPQAECVVTAQLHRHAGRPTYETPWLTADKFVPAIQPRQA